MPDEPKWASEEESRAQFQRLTDSSRTSKSEMIAQGKEFDPSVSTLLEALEAFYMNGFAHESSGNVEAPTGHFYRVDRWIVTTSNQGFKDIWNYPSVARAKEEFQRWDEEYIAWEDE